MIITSDAECGVFVTGHAEEDKRDAGLAETRRIWWQRRPARGKAALQRRHHVLRSRPDVSYMHRSTGDGDVRVESQLSPLPRLLSVDPDASSFDHWFLQQLNVSLIFFCHILNN